LNFSIQLKVKLNIAVFLHTVKSNKLVIIALKNYKRHFISASPKLPLVLVQVTRLIPLTV